MRMHALLCALLLLGSSSAHAQEEGPPPLVLRATDAAAAPVAAVEVYTPTGALLTLGDAYGFVSLPARAADSAYLIIRAAGYHTDTLFPPFGEEVLLRRTGDRTIAEVIVRADAVTPITPSRRDAVIDYCFVGDYLLVATTRSPRRSALLLLSPRGDTVAHTTLRDEPDGVYTACDGTPYVVFYHLNRFQPVSSVEAQLQLGKRYPMQLFGGVEACQLALNDALYYRSFSPDEFALRLWRWRTDDTAPEILAQHIDTATARADEYEDANPDRKRYLVRSHRMVEGPEARRLRTLRNKIVYRELMGNLMLLHDTLLLPDFRTRRIVHYNGEGKELMAPTLRFSWGSMVQFALLQDAASGRIYLHRYARPQAQTVQELDPRTGALTGREVRIEKPFAKTVRIRGGRIFYLWQDDRAMAMQQLFAQPLATRR